MNSKQVEISVNQGFSLIELMISMAIGTFLLAGVFTIFLNSSTTQRQVQDQIAMMDNARFALETISYDLRHAGIFGRRAMVNDSSFNNSKIAGISGECYPGWVTDVVTVGVDKKEPVTAFDDNNPYPGTCTQKWFRGDVLEMRYTLGAPVTNLLPNTLYLNADLNLREFFIGNTSPNIMPEALDYQVVAHSYYISKDSDTVGDGIPSLHRVSLQTGAAGPEVVDEMLLSGVYDLQVQFGIDHDGGDTLSGYVNPEDPLLIDHQFLFAQVWIVVQSTEPQREFDTGVTFNIAGETVVIPDDDYRKVLLSTVVQVRNL